MNPNIDHSGLPNSVTRVILCVDSSIASTRAATYVCQLGLAGVQIRIVSVVDSVRMFLPSHTASGLILTAAYDELRESATAALADARQIFDDHGIAADTELTDVAKHGGDIAHALAAEADAWDADLIVLGARQHHGLLRWVEGAVSEPVAKLVRCPILIVPASYEPNLEHGLKRILFAIDGSPACEQALRTGITLAATDAHLRALFVVDRAVRLSDIVPIYLLEEAIVEEGKSAIAKTGEIFASLREGLHSDTGFLRTKRTNDDIPHTIVREANRWPADLLVLGTHGRRGAALWILGSIASRVARITETPLLLVRAHYDDVTSVGPSLTVKSLWNQS